MSQKLPNLPKLQQDLCPIALLQPGYLQLEAELGCMHAYMYHVED